MKRFVITYKMVDRITNATTIGTVKVKAASDKEAKENFEKTTTTKTFVGIRPE